MKINVAITSIIFYTINIFAQTNYIAVKTAMEANLPNVALKTLERMSEDSKDYIYWYYKGNAHNSLSHYEEAIVALNKSIELNSTDSAVFMAMAFAHMKLGEIDKASTFINKAVAINPTNPACYMQQAEIYIHKKDYISAENVLHTAYRLAALDIIVQKLAQVYMLQKKYQEAKILLMKRLPLHEVYYLMAKVYEQNADLEGALKHYRLSLSAKTHFEPSAKAIKRILNDSV